MRQTVSGFGFTTTNAYDALDRVKTYPMDAALRAAAGRTNTGMNAYGAGVGAAGAGGAMCGCPN